MPKDRFSKFKPINWNSDWKKTGNFGSQYNTLERKDAYDAYAKNAELKQKITIQKQQKQVSVKPKKTIRTPEQTNKLELLYDLVKTYLNEWEASFFNTLLSHSFSLTEKQTEILKKTWLKYRNQYLKDNY